MSLAFLRAFLAKPGQIGSIVPSSRALSRAVVDHSDIHPDHAVVELGAGPGPITAALLERFPDLELLSVEPEADLVRKLRERFPGLEVRQTYADSKLPELTAAWGHPRIDRVVSGLPWTVWPAEVQDEVFAGITAALKPDGRFCTYTYLPVPLTPGAARLREAIDRWFEQSWMSKVVLANVPPAWVVVAEGPRPEPDRAS